METRFKSSRRPSVVKEASRRNEGVNFVPNEMAVEKEYQYQDLKKLKNTSLFFPGLDQITATIQDDTALKFAQLFQPTYENQTHVAPLQVFQPVTEGSSSQKGIPEFQPFTDDFLEPDCAPPTPCLLGENDPSMTIRQEYNPFPELPILDDNVMLQGLEKVLQVPELPQLEEERNWLENLKKAECQASGVAEYDYEGVAQYESSLQPSSSFASFQPEEDSFVSVQTKKQRTSAVSCVPREDLCHNFVQHELRQVNHFIPGTVQYTTKSALTEFVHSLPKLTYGTHGCIIEEGYNPDGEEYMEKAHYVMDRRLGSGSYGNVDLAIDSISGKRLVRKRIKKEHIQKGEIVIPLNLNSKHVTKVIGLIQRQTEDDVRMELFLEYAGRSLNIYLIQEGNNLVADQIWKLTKQALKGLTHIHKYGMIHLDIKPENLCVREVDDGLELKITDFGSAKLSYDDITFNGWTPEYMAPESCQYFLQTMHNQSFGLKQEDITGKVDVFALSLVIGYMYGKKHVLLSLITQGRGNYNGLTPEERKEHQTQLIVMMASTGADVDALINDSCDLDMRDLLKKMSYPREARVTAREALDIIEMREQNQQRIQRDNELKLQQLHQRLLRQQKLHIEYQVPDLNKIGLPATVVPVISRERSIVKDKLREKLMPYKKIPRPETPQTPMTPVEEMQNLQIRVAGGKGKHMEETPLQNPCLETVEEEPDVAMTTVTMQAPNMTVELVMEPPRTHSIITTPVDTPLIHPEPQIETMPQSTQLMPTPAVLGCLVMAASPVVNMNYDDFIDIRNQRQESAELQGNIPNIVFDF